MQITSTIASEIGSIITGRCIEHEPLFKHTSFGIGGPADLLVLPVSENDLVNLFNYVRERDIPIYIIGNGTNLLVSDEGLHGVVLKLERMRELQAEGSIVHCGSGVPLVHFARWTADRGLAGLEFAAGIPASVGGAVYMNAGAEGRTIGELVRAVRYVDRFGVSGEVAAGDLHFGYRSSDLQGSGRVIVRVSMELTPEDSVLIKSRLSKNLERRKKTQPYIYRSAGSYFKNPPGHSAGKLIEMAGCKGWQVGGAQVSLKHANFLINIGSATAKDVITLASRIQKQVEEKFGVILEPEVKYLQ